MYCALRSPRPEHALLQLGRRVRRSLPNRRFQRLLVRRAAQVCDTLPATFTALRRQFPVTAKHRDQRVLGLHRAQRLTPLAASSGGPSAGRPKCVLIGPQPALCDRLEPR